MYSCIRLNGELVDYEPSSEEEMNDEIQWMFEMADVSNSDPTETSKESVSSHQSAKTVKKTNKKKSMEQRARQKRTLRIDVIPELEDA